MTFAQLRRQGDALMRKYANEREIYRASPSPSNSATSRHDPPRTTSWV